MIAAAIVCAAALSHGAALNWGISGIPNNGTTDIVANSAYWIAAASMDDFNAAADKWAYVDGVAAGNKAAGTVTGGRSYMVSGTYGDFKAGDPIQGFIVAFDAGHENYVASGFADFLSPGAGSPTYPVTFADTTGWKPNSSGPVPPPIPEPTSGLLLLLGTAGLALRRRRA